MALFDAEFMERLEYLSLLARRVFRGHVLAQRRTRQLGSGVEFADHREYVPGDDFRAIDWNLYARHGEFLLKRFQEEEDLHVHVFVDCSRSMDTGSPRKFDHARKLAAALAYIALSNLDRVSLIAHADRVLGVHPLTRGKDRILALLRFLEELSPVGTDTDLQASVREFLQGSPRRGLVVMVGDFFDPKGALPALDALRYHQHEPQVLQIWDRAEAEPTMLGDVEFEDVETGARSKVTVTESNLARYREVFQGSLEQLRRYCLSHGMACTQARTDVPFDELVVRMMRLSGAVQ